MKTILTIVILGFCNLSMSQNFQKDFADAFRANDTLNQLRILSSWETAKPNDPELYTSFYNYYFRLSRNEVVSLTSERPESESLVLQDSLNNTAGYLGSTVYHNPSVLKKAFDKINRGIELYPNRLDMRFGKIYGMGETDGWEDFTNEIISTVNHSKVNQNKWLWTNNESKPDAKEFMLSAIQSYQLQLYNTGNDDLLPNMQRIALAILNIYPEHIESLSNLSVTYFINKEYDKGLEVLLKAEKLDPKDFIVLSNIANGYRLKGNTAKSVEYYEKTLLYGDEEAKAFAKERLEMLKK